MPLEHSSSQEAFKRNIAAEVNAGKDPKQAAAIAYSIKRKAGDDNIGATHREIDINDYVAIESNPISRSGVFPYLGKSIGAPEPDKTYMVYRPAEELENPDAIASFRTIPLINDHVMLGNGAGLMLPEKKGIEGVTGDKVEFKNGVLYANLKIFSQKLYDLIKAGKNNLSLGYRCTYEKAAGIFAGQPYDYIQRNLRGNHLALVDQARCDVAVLDAVDGVITFDHFDINFIGVNDMAEKEMEEKEEEKKKAEDAEKEEKGAEGKKDAENANDKEDDEEEEKKEAKDKKHAKDADMESGEGVKHGAKITGDKKAKDEDMEEEKGMDAAEVFKFVTSQIKHRDALAKELSNHIGTFDASEKTLAEVASYGVKKLGLKCEKGQEEAVISGFLAGRKLSTTGFALDSRATTSLDSKFANYLNKK